MLLLKPTLTEIFITTLWILTVEILFATLKYDSDIQVDVVVSKI